MSGCWVEHVLGITGLMIGGQGMRVVGQNLKRQFTAAKLPGFRFGPTEQGLADALATVLFGDDDVVDIEQGLGGKS